MKKRLKNLLLLAVACGSFGALFTGTVLAQSKCLEWAEYGSYDLGSWGDNNNVIRASVSASSKYETNSGWKRGAESQVSSCYFDADFAFGRASSLWPEQRRKIQVYFEKAVKECKSHYRSRYKEHAGQFCKD